MSVNLQQTALMAYLQKKHSGVYHGKILELRDAVEGWLAYIPQTFPHYTRHTVQHTDEIVLQLSKLLFKDDDPKQPVIQLSAAEAYILIASAYLHDAGMVVSDREKVEILASDGWKRWATGQGGGANRWREIQALRQGREPADETLRNFLADIQIRFLVAEFIRRTHHLRAAEIITQHQATLGRFAFDDPMLLRTISDVCVAHGFRQHELEDPERYPDRRDIRGEKVNVRFMAILLRLGDLLDMSYDRACPLLLNAACPLPAESLAHWTQYQRIVHRLTAPDKIELIAECQTQEEHRFLQDWCQWLVDEVREAGVVMARTIRHNDWQPPKVGLGEGDSTIIIRPAPDATYIPSRWTFELDHDAVFERLIKDVYDHPAAFIRELIQNALDANRCKMYADLVRDGLEPPEYSTQIDEERRLRYPVRISLAVREVYNELSGETEAWQVLIVDDCGIGMDTEIIMRYFLQVGRSYYTTDEFRRSFRFVPTSRFGVGFLSVFAVSDHVTVETYKPSSPRRDGPICLTLTGPRNYLLTDRGDRRSSGTRIQVLLREPMEQGELTELISQWCRRVEFPVIVDDLRTQTTVEAERPEQFTYEIPDVTEEGAKLAVRAFSVNRLGIEGELYVFARIDDKGESWAEWVWAHSDYPRKHPQATEPEFPGSLTCLHGIAVEQEQTGYMAGPASARLDYRSDTYRLTVSRERAWPRPTGSGVPREINSRWEEILREHLATTSRATSEDGWKYKQKLVRYFDLPSFWASLPETIRIHIESQQRLVSLEELQAMPVVRTTMRLPRRYYSRVLHDESSHTDKAAPAWDSDIPTITSDDLVHISDAHRKAFFTGRLATHVRRLFSGHLAIDWRSHTGDVLFYSAGYGQEASLTAIPCPMIIGLAIHATIHSFTEHLLLNENHPFVQWLVLVSNACDQGRYGLKVEQFKHLTDLLSDVIRYTTKEHLSALKSYLDIWRQLPNLPPELYPPEIELTEDGFMWRDNE